MKTLGHIEHKFVSNSTCIRPLLRLTETVIAERYWFHKYEEGFRLLKRISSQWRQSGISADISTCAEDFIQHEKCREDSGELFRCCSQSQTYKEQNKGFRQVRAK